MIYLGVDVGANTGLAAIEVTDTDVICLHREVIALEGEYGERLIQLEAALFEFIKAIRRDPAVKTVYRPRDIDMLVVEEPPRVRNTSVYNQLSGYEAIVIKVCEDLCVPYVSGNNASIKKIVCRGGAVGKTTKDDMMLKAAELIDEIIPPFDTKKERDYQQNGYDAVLCAFYAKYVKEGQ